MRKAKRFTAILLMMAVALGGCGTEKKEESKEWTYELLEEEFGGIIELDCLSIRDCLNDFVGG